MADDSQIKALYNLTDSCFFFKAASGIRSAQIVQEMINAGVDRFGISHSSVMKIIWQLATVEKSL